MPTEAKIRALYAAVWKARCASDAILIKTLLYTAVRVFELVRIRIAAPGTGALGSLEIHRGSFSVFDDFQQTLDRELTAKGATLTVRLDEWPLEVRDRNVLHTRISKAIDTAVAAGTRQVVRMPELGKGATGVVEPRQKIPGLGRIVVHHEGITPTEGYLASVAARLARKVNLDKAGQGRKGRWDANRTVLLVNVSTARLAGSWAKMASLPGSTMCRSTGATSRLPPWRCASAISTARFCGGGCRYRPDLDAADRVHLEPVLAALDLPSTPAHA